MTPNVLEGRLIAFFHQSADLYGSDRILLHLALAVQQQGGHSVVLLPEIGPLTEELAAHGIEFHVLPVLKVSRAMLSPKGLLTLWRESRAALAAYDQVFGDRRVDLVHSNTLAVLGGGLWARSRRIPHLWHVHEIIEHPWIAAYAFPLLVSAVSDGVVCNSHATYSWLLRARPRLREKMRVIWNGVLAPARLDDSTVSELRSRFRPDGARLAIGLIGRINRLKGHSLLIDAADLLFVKGVRDFSIVLIGSAPPGQEHFEQQLAERIARSPMRERIVVQGFAKDIWPAYSALDIVCVPSTEVEAFGLVAAEAMASGKPVIAARLGGLAEVIEDGISGLAFKPRDAAALAAALESLLHDEALRDHIGHGAKDRIQSTFSVEKMQSQFVGLYKSTIYATV